MISRETIRNNVLDTVKDSIWEVGRINLVGVRGHKSGREVENDPDLYNDTIYLVEPTGVIHAFTASVDPGIVKNPNPKGIAKLVRGQYLFRKGLHKSKNPALRQAEKVKIYRIDPKTRETLLIEVGWYGINIHSAGWGQHVGDWSHGCQVVHGSQWDEFWALIDESGQDKLHYTLLERIHEGQADQVVHGGTRPGRGNDHHSVPRNKV